MVIYQLMMVAEKIENIAPRKGTFGAAGTAAIDYNLALGSFRRDGIASDPGTCVQARIDQ